MYSLIEVVLFSLSLFLSLSSLSLLSLSSLSLLSTLARSLSLKIVECTAAAERSLCAQRRTPPRVSSIESRVRLRQPEPLTNTIL